MLCEALTLFSCHLSPICTLVGDFKKNHLLSALGEQSFPGANGTFLLDQTSFPESNHHGWIRAFLLLLSRKKACRHGFAGCVFQFIGIIMTALLPSEAWSIREGLVQETAESILILQEPTTPFGTQLQRPLNGPHLQCLLQKRKMQVNYHENMVEDQITNVFSNFRCNSDIGLWLKKNKIKKRIR